MKIHYQPWETVYSSVDKKSLVHETVVAINMSQTVRPLHWIGSSWNDNFPSEISHMTAIPREHPRWFQTVAYPTGLFAQLLAFLTNKLPVNYRESLFEFPFSLSILKTKCERCWKFLVEQKQSPVVFQSLKLWLVEEQEGLTSFELLYFLSILNLLSCKTLHNQSSNGAIHDRNSPIFRS